MKKGAFPLLILAGIYLSSCQKETGIGPQSSGNLNSKSTIITAPALNNSNTTSGPNTPAIDTVKGYLRIQLAANTINTDNILIKFNPAASAAFSKNEDATYLKGFGVVSLSSLSSDGIACAINTLPLTTPNCTVALNVGAKSDGLYTLNLLSVASIPETYDIWLKDKYKKDSLDFRHNITYAFDIITKDTSSYGSGRFSIVLRKK